VEAEARERNAGEDVDDRAAGEVVLGGIEGELDALRDGHDLMGETQRIDGFAGVDDDGGDGEAQEDGEPT